LSTAPRLSLSHITKSFDGQKVVDDVTLDVMPGQVTCLLGPSGCGKSTTLRIAAGVDLQDSGEIYLDGALICDGVRRVPPENRSIGLMFQDFALFPHLSVAQNVAFGIAKSDAPKRVPELLDKVGMLRHIDRYPHELSGGEQQRVALARALAPRPRVMLMDEPFSGLDDRLRDDIRNDTLDVLKEEGAAVLLVTHEPAEAMRMANEIALMRDGRIVQQGAPYDIYNAPVDLSAAQFFSNINVLSSKVKAEKAETAFGNFAATGFLDGQIVDVAIRPQHLKVDFDRNGKGPSSTEKEGTAVRASVKRSRYIGSQSLVDFELDHDGALMTATIPSVFLPKSGTAMWLMLPRDRCFVFSRS